MRKKKKNVSKRVPNGRTVQTRDEYFEGKGSYRKPGYANKGNYRPAVVVDSNERDELALVKGVSHGKNPGPGWIRSYKPFIETKDDEGRPIKLGPKFQENPRYKDISPKDANRMKRECINDSKTGKKNRIKLRRLKNRQKKMHRK